MGKYKIGQLNLEFDYCFNDFFKDSFLSYQVPYDQVAKYKMSSICVENIEENENKIFQNKNKKIYSKDGYQIIDVYDTMKTKVMTRVSMKPDLTDVKIEFSKKLGSRLSEYEYTLTGVYFLSMCVKEGLIPLHASAISYRGKAILFSAPSGIGKSTQSKLWKKVFPEVDIINDDKPLLGLEGSEWYVYGSPWSGKEGHNKNIKVELGAIVFLQQASNNQIKKFTDEEKLSHLMKNIHRPNDEEDYNTLFKQLGPLIEKTLMFEYSCNMEEEAVTVLHNTIYKEQME